MHLFCNNKAHKSSRQQDATKEELSDIKVEENPTKDSRMQLHNCLAYV